ncbi:ParB family protein [Pseudomonas sp. TNT2022 ID357]|uniref:ParB family protein n=1 Tax=Pseudomonas idahonensis TaxID=2942628 RepID=A0ABT5QEQ2_9PSED|nr:ParB family protein [Pseudomonas idahonensis]MDD1152700.1 ParB family protein [Pseudomonas idahonensis]
MAELSPQDMVLKLLNEGFSRTGPVAETLTDPIVDTAMVVTLDELRSYELNPRVTRNPLFDEIKASIRERGLDAPPAITRRPGEPHFVIRNGGNTRLAILRELWTETKDEQYFRIFCLFRPWPRERGEIMALTGHLAENELHGGLSFIERALGVEKAREFYELEDGKPLSQSELARRLKIDGYPIAQPHISRMQDAVQHLLPAIPNILYGGLGRPMIEQLTGLRRAAARTWESHASEKLPAIDFPTLFQDVLTAFDASPATFLLQRVQDELIGQMADLLGMSYDMLALQISDSGKRWNALSSDLTDTAVSSTVPPTEPLSRTPSTPLSDSHTSPTKKRSDETADSSASATDTGQQHQQAGEQNALPQGHTISPIATTDRLQSIQRLVDEHIGETAPDLDGSALQAIPIQVDGLYPISDIWYIAPNLQTPDHLRAHIAQFAREIAAEAGAADSVSPSAQGIGFTCVDSIVRVDTSPIEPFAHAVLVLLHALSAPFQPVPPSTSVDHSQPVENLGPLLQGPAQTIATTQQRIARLSDAGLVKLFRLLRLARCLLDLEAGASSPSDSSNGE